MSASLWRSGIAPVLLAAWVSCTACSDGGGGAAAQPNILVFLMDDLGYGDVHAYNPGALTETPNIDRIADEGMRFTDAHSAASVCSPSRYAILTGRYAWRTRLKEGVLSYFAEPLLEPDRLTLPDMLRERGYATAAFGKWHLGLDVARADGTGFVRPDVQPQFPDFGKPVGGGPADHGFDYYFGKAGDSVRGFIENRTYVGLPVRKYRTGRFEIDGWDEGQASVLEAGKALEFLDRAAAARPPKPFFIFYASHSPHGPYISPAEVSGKAIAGHSALGARGDELLEGDAILGLLLDRLDSLGIARNTLVLVTGDNGPSRRAHGTGVESAHDPTGGLRGWKGDLWEGGHRVPLLARWGDGTEAGSTILPGSSSDTLIGLQDLMGTLADLLDEDLPADAAEDSESFRFALLGEDCADCARRTLVHHSAAGVFAVREGNLKMIPGRGSGGFKQRHKEREVSVGQLYDLDADLAESTNLFGQRSADIARLETLLERYRSLDHTARRISP